MDQLNRSVTNQSGKLNILVKVMLVLLVGNLVLERSLQLLPIYTLGDNFSLGNTLGLSLKLPFFWTGLAEPILYLCALWSAAQVLKKYETVRRLDSRLLPDLRRLGGYLMYASMAAILFVPSIEGWLNQGIRHLQWDWNNRTVAIGLIGLILKFVANGEQSSNIAAPTSVN
ncbi:MAG: hypothetical protein ACEQSE_03680 [Candidatus Aquirickettsiella gammari]